MIDNQLEGSDGGGAGIRSQERGHEIANVKINHIHHSSSLSLSPRRSNAPPFDQVINRENRLSSSKFHTISHKPNCPLSKQIAAANTNNLNRSSAPTDIDDQEFYENGLVRRQSNSIGEKGYSQSDEEESYRSSKDLSLKACPYCYAKEASPGYSSNTLYDVLKLPGRHYTDKTISTCISYKTASNRQSNNTNYNTSSSNQLNQRNSSQINSYFSHLNSNTSQSPQETSPLDLAVMTCQLQNNCRGGSCNGEHLPKCYPQPFSLDQSQNYNEKIHSQINSDIEKFTLQKSPNHKDQQIQGSPINTNGYNKGSYQNNLIYQNAAYPGSPQSDHSCNSYNCQCMLNGKVYNNNNNNCSNFMGSNNNLHRIKEEAESDTYSIYSYSVRLRHTPPQSNNEDKIVSNNPKIQSKVAAARHLLRQSQNSDSSNSNNQKLSNHTSPKSQYQKEDSRHVQGGNAEENIYFYTTDERQLSQSIQIDFQRIPSSNTQQSPLQKPIKQDSKQLDENKQNKMCYLKVPIVKYDAKMEGRSLVDGENNQKLSISTEIKDTNDTSSDKLISQVQDCQEVTYQDVQGCDKKLNQKDKKEQSPQEEVKEIITPQISNNKNKKQDSNLQESKTIEINEKEDTSEAQKVTFVDDTSERVEQQSKNSQNEINQSQFTTKNQIEINEQKQSSQHLINDENKKDNKQNSLVNSNLDSKDQQELLEEIQFPPQLSQTSSSLLKKNQPFLLQLQAEESNWHECDLDYEGIKQYVITQSSKLLEKKTLTQKFPVFQRVDENFPDKQSFAALSQANIPQYSNSKAKVSQDSQYFVNLLKGQQHSPPGQNDLPTHQNQKSFSHQVQQQSPLANRGYSQRFSLGSPTNYVSNIDNMIYHIFSTPQKSLSEVLKEVDSQEVICAELLSKKIPGFIDRWKKKFVFLYLDKFCYQENKNSPISTISFKHFDVQVIKDNFRNTFTLTEQNTKKRFTFKCQDAEQNQFWVQTIADIIIFNQMYPKYKLYPENTVLYQKQQICFPHDIQSTLFTGDLVIYRTFNPKTQKPEKKQEVAMIIRTQYILQVCYYSEEEGILTYPFDTFLMLHNLASFSFRRLQRTKETDESKSDENLTSKCVSFVSENSMKKYKDSNQLVYEILKECKILKEKSPSKILQERDIYETTRLNLYTDKCKYSDVIFLVLKNHICSVTSNPQLLNSIFTDPQQSKANENNSGLPKILIDGYSPNSYMLNQRNQSVRHFPHCSSMYQHQEQQNDERNSSFGSNNRLFGRFSYIEYGKDYIRNSYNSSSMKYL